MGMSAEGATRTAGISQAKGQSAVRFFGRHFMFFCVWELTGRMPVSSYFLPLSAAERSERK